MNATLRERAAGALRSGSSLRLVARARLTVPDMAEVPRARFVLEDALNTADFGDYGRLIVVRRLRLPRLPADASGRSVALALEQAWRAAAGEAVPFDDPRAALAETVFAPNTETARATLLERVACGADTGAWFWPRLVPEFEPASAAGDNAVRLIAAAFQDAPAWAVLAAAVVAWPQARVLALLRLLPREMPHLAAFEPLRRVASRAMVSAAPKPSAQPREHSPARGVPTPPAGTAIEAAAAALAALLPPGSAFAAEPWSGPDDWRVLLLAHAVWTAGHRAIPEAARLVEVAKAWEERRIPASSSEARAPESAPRPLPSIPPGRTAPAGGTGPGVVSLPVSAPEPVRPAPAQPVAGIVPPEAPRPLGDRPAPWLLDTLHTEAGGLLMLLNVLKHLGFEHWLELQRPENRWPFVATLVATLSDRAAVPFYDPQRELFAIERDRRHLLLRTPCHWGGFDWPPWLRRAAPPDAQSGARSVRRWSAAVGRSLRLAAGLSVAQVVRREARVSATATHVDVLFALADVDMAIRRAGLDADPGWVPWFGRIVAFHFIDFPSEPRHA